MQKITFYERQKIELYLRIGKTHRWIARRLNRDHTVISREIKRNSGNYLPYAALNAQRISDQRAKKTNKRKLEKYENKNLKKYVENCLENDLSPEQIAGRLKDQPPPDIKQTISHESIYQHIYNGQGQYGQLYYHLRTKRTRRRKKFSRKKQAKISIKNRISIHQRPKVIDKKKRFGDWEADSMLFSKQKNILSVMYERKSMLCKLQKLENKTADATENSIAFNIESLPKELFKTITRDNGTENANHQETSDNLNIQSYFCDTYASWQKGGVENLNKLIRQYLPRKTDMSRITDDDICKIEQKLNNRPRKSLKYLTPNEIVGNYISGALNS